jgi:hypothetical protein
MVGADVTALVSSASKSSLDGLPRTSTRLHDDILLPTETVKVRSEAREFVGQVLAPRAAEPNSAEESSAAFPYDIMHQMTDASLYAFPFNADVGGRGLEYPMLGAAKVLAELAYYPRGVASALYDSQALLVGRTLDAARHTFARSSCPGWCAAKSSDHLLRASPCVRGTASRSGRKKEGKQPL